MTDIEYQINDCIMERPYPFIIEDKTFYIYPMTLGKLLLTQRMIEQLGFDAERMQRNAQLEICRITKANKGACCELMAYITARNDYYSVFDRVSFLERKRLFLKQPNEDVSSVLMLILTEDRTQQFISHLGIGKELEAMRTVMKVKSDKNNLSFCGVSIYGSLIDVAMERYKMTKRQVIWEIDYTSLRLLIADKVNSVYVTDEELAKIPVNIRNRNDVVIKPTKENMEKILAMDWR